MKHQTWWRNWQRVEGGLIFASALALLWPLGADLPWWLALLTFFAPDFSFAAYGLGKRVGSTVYNLVHLYAFGMVVLAAGLVLSLPVAASLGALWMGHAGFDRALGYGLKAPESFSLTHLGPTGKARG